MTSEIFAESTTLDEIIRNGSRPVLFENTIENWPARHWKPRDLATFLGDKPFRCKVAARHSDEIQWETNCFHLEATVSQFVDWLEDGPLHDNPFASLDKEMFSVYVDYKYMAAMFKDQPHLLKAVDWGVLGLPGRGGEASTLWLGSAGTSTPCHQDCYGFNLVAQLYGRKRWVLFPPSNKLYPSRIPFEESSIFSEVNIVRPDLQKHPEFKEATPAVVELRPGQVLYVPRHWWHYVESLEPSISINTWVEMEADDEERVREAIVRTLVSGLATGVDSSCLPLTQLLNPNEALLPMTSNLEYLSQTLRVVCQSQQLKHGHTALVEQGGEHNLVSAATPAEALPESPGKSLHPEETGLQTDCIRRNAHFGDCCKHVSNLERFACAVKGLPVRVKASTQLLLKKSGSFASDGNSKVTGLLERGMSVESFGEDCADETGVKSSGISDDERWKSMFDENESVSSKRERGFLTETFSSINGKECPPCKDTGTNGNLKRKFDFQDGDHHLDCKVMKLEESTAHSTDRCAAADVQESFLTRVKTVKPEGHDTGTGVKEQMKCGGNQSDFQEEVSSSSLSPSPRRKFGRVEARGSGVYSSDCSCSNEKPPKSGEEQNASLQKSTCACGLNTSLVDSSQTAKKKEEPISRIHSAVEAYVLETSTIHHLRQVFARETDSMEAADGSSVGSGQTCKEEEEEEEGEERAGQEPSFTVETFVKAVLHPRVVQTIAEVLKDNMS